MLNLVIGKPGNVIGYVDRIGQAPRVRGSRDDGKGFLVTHKEKGWQT